MRIGRHYTLWKIHQIHNKIVGIWCQQSSLVFWGRNKQNRKLVMGTLVVAGFWNLASSTNHFRFTVIETIIVVIKFHCGNDVEREKVKILKADSLAAAELQKIRNPIPEEVLRAKIATRYSFFDGFSCWSLQFCL